jgi:hypothetical protein
MVSAPLELSEVVHFSLKHKLRALLSLPSARGFYRLVKEPPGLLRWVFHVFRCLLYNFDCIGAKPPAFPFEKDDLRSAAVQYGSDRVVQTFLRFFCLGAVFMVTLVLLFSVVHPTGASCAGSETTSFYLRVHLKDSRHALRVVDDTASRFPSGVKGVVISSPALILAALFAKARVPACPPSAVSCARFFLTPP